MTERTAARVVSRSARATHALGARLGKLLRPGDVVALVGDLGAGKTQLVRGACSGAGVRPEEVSSPSFAIVATYRGRIPVHHADLYRIADEDELHATGFGDLVGGEGALLVEWADRVPGALPEEKLEITLEHHPTAPSVRSIAIEGVGERHAALASRLAKPPPRPRLATKPPPRRPAKKAPPRRPAKKPPPRPREAGERAGVRGRSISGSRSRSRSRSGSRSRSRSQS